MSDWSRERVQGLIEAGSAAEAKGGLEWLWRHQASPALANFVLQTLPRLPGPALVPVPVTILRSFTVEPMVPFLRAEAGFEGLDAQVSVGGFNTWQQEMHDPNSSLYAARPRVVFLAVQTRDLAPGLWDGTDLAQGEEALAQLRSALASFRKNTDAALVIHTLEQPAEAAAGLYDAQTEGQRAALGRCNAGLAALAKEYSGVYLLDYDALTACYGRSRWFDAAKWKAVRLPVAGEFLPVLGREWARFLPPLTGKTIKVAVLDLDNTLWGGVIGEDGMDGIRLSPEGAGAPYYALQRALRDLKRRGILLAVASKNNLADAVEAMDRHPHMLLRQSEFAAARINWQDKATSLREIATELNVGLDALAFLDDNPTERQWVRQQLPEVRVLELGEDAREYAALVRSVGSFEVLHLSQEDKERGTYYAQQRQRAELAQAAGTVEEYYRSLEQVIRMAPLCEATLERAAQLTQKTNQFNTTTRRYTVAEMAAAAAEPGVRVWTLQVLDKFGDNGIVGVMITREREKAWEIDTFLLSCRVIGRTVETAMLAIVMEEGRKAGVEVVEGWFRPTKKNVPAREVYARHGFSVVREDESGTCWARPLSERLMMPEWIRIEESQDWTK
jgi:FkbH-like protein